MTTNRRTVQQQQPPQEPRAPPKQQAQGPLAQPKQQAQQQQQLNIVNEVPEEPFDPARLADPLPPELRALQACIEEYSKELAQEEEKLRKKGTEDEFKVLYGSLKPLFKEWLEIRCDFDQRRGGARKLTASDGAQLMGRSSKLQEYIKDYIKYIQSAYIKTEVQAKAKYLGNFAKWLLHQVNASKNAIYKASVDFKPGDGSGGPNSQVTTSSPSQPLSARDSGNRGSRVSRKAPIPGAGATTTSQVVRTSPNRPNAQDKSKRKK